MALPDMDSLVGYSFGLEFDGITIKSITELTGLKLEQDVIELKQNTADGKYVLRKLPGKPKGAQITVTMPATGDNSLEKWCKDARFGKMSSARKGCAVILYDYEGNPIKRFRLINAWPSSLEIGSLQAGGTSVLTEKLVVTADQIEVE